MHPYSSSADIRKAAFKTTQYGLRLQKTDMIDSLMVEKPSGARMTIRRHGQVPDETCLVWNLK